MRKLLQDIDFDRIILKIKSQLHGTDILGRRRELLFKFSDLTLQTLTQHIRLAFETKQNNEEETGQADQNNNDEDEEQLKI